MNRKLIVMGNGFDLAHGLPTRYTDFLTHYLNDRIHQGCAYPPFNKSVYGDGDENFSINDALGQRIHTTIKQNQQRPL